MHAPGNARALARRRTEPSLRWIDSPAIDLLRQIVGLGDSQTVSASTPALGDATITFSAVPVPELSSALLIGLGLATMGMRASKRRPAAIAF